MKKIINIGIVAHVDAGKTTITENLLYFLPPVIFSSSFGNSSSMSLKKVSIVIRSVVCLLK